jgi:hypothetical protein
MIKHGIRMAVAGAVLTGLALATTPVQATPEATASTATCEFPRLVAINDLRMYEGSGPGPLGNGLTLYQFTVTTAGCSDAVTVEYLSTFDSSDYVPVSGTLTWGNGDTTSRTITVPVHRDSTDENNEAVHVFLEATSGWADVDTQGVGTILDDDGPISWNVDDVQCWESDPGAGQFTNCTYTITRSLTGVVGSIRLTTQDATAHQPQDYLAVDKVHSVPSNKDNVHGTVSIRTNHLCQGDRVVWLMLSNQNPGEIADGQGMLLIKDDDIFCDDTRR